MDRAFELLTHVGLPLGFVLAVATFFVAMVRLNQDSALRRTSEKEKAPERQP